MREIPKGKSHDTTKHTDHDSRREVHVRCRRLFRQPADCCVLSCHLLGRDAPLTFQMSPDGVDFHDLRHVTPGSLDSYEDRRQECSAGCGGGISANDGYFGFLGEDTFWYARDSSGQAARRKFEFVVEDADAAAGGGAGAEGPTGPAG